MGMATTNVIATEMYTCVDPVKNQVRFWKYERLSTPVSEPGKKGVMETGDLRITWGRVGEPGESQLKPYSDKWLSSKIKEKTTATKERQAYTKVNTVAGTEAISPPTSSYGGSSSVTVTSAEVKKAAVAEIAGGCPVTAALVRKLAETNKHELVKASGGVIKDGRIDISQGGMDIDLETGLVRTALGVVTLDAVKEARQILDQMLPYVTKHDTENTKYTDFLGSYLRLVPQNVGTRKRGWYADFINIAAQTSLLDQLETSVELAGQRIAGATKTGKSEVKSAPKQQSIFECKLRLLDETTEHAIWERVKKSFFATVNYGHTSSSLKPVRMYEVTIPHMIQAFDMDGKKVGNVKELWHGTRVFNILSILKRGFVLPTQLSSAQTTGAMFGNGVYFSDQSTKSLNYSQGYWDGGSRDNNCYMFRVNVAMGREYIPNGPCNGIPSQSRNQYDSCHAVANRSGVRNDEQIVYRTSQADIKYLVEFNNR